MSQQPPDWWARQRGSRIGCADVTIVSIASITAFIILIFVVLRPDSGRFVELGGSNVTVAAVRATETPVRTSGLVALPPTATAAPTPTPVPPTPTVQPTPSFRKLNVRQECRMRQDTNFEALVIQTFRPGQPFKIYTEQRVTGDGTWWRVEPDDGTSRQGWMISSCFS